MRKHILAVMVGIVLSCTAAMAGQFDNIVSSADVQKITGLTGIKQVPRDQTSKFKNGDLNFVLGADSPLLMIEFRPVFVFESMRNDAGYFKKSLPGIGEEAFTSPAFDPQFSVNFRKGRYMAVITTHIDPQDKKKTVLTMDQLIALAKLVESRM